MKHRLQVTAIPYCTVSPFAFVLPLFPVLSVSVLARAPYYFGTAARARGHRISSSCASRKRVTDARQPIHRVIAVQGEDPITRVIHMVLANMQRPLFTLSIHTYNSRLLQVLHVYPRHGRAPVLLSFLFFFVRTDTLRDDDRHLISSPRPARPFPTLSSNPTARPRRHSPTTTARRSFHLRSYVCG